MKEQREELLSIRWYVRRLRQSERNDRYRGNFEAGCTEQSLRARFA
jgi:hypothetical protein